MATPTEVATSREQDGVVLVRLNVKTAGINLLPGKFTTPAHPDYAKVLALVGKPVPGVTVPAPKRPEPKTEAPAKDAAKDKPATTSDKAEEKALLGRVLKGVGERLKESGVADQMEAALAAPADPKAA